MKKISLTLIVMGIMSVSTVHATNSGEVHFIGSVTDITCNINPFVEGVQSDIIQLGTMKTDGTGAVAVNFSLVPDNAACLTKTSANVGWQSSVFTPEGLGNISGSATGAFIKLTALNSGSTAISGNTQNANFNNSAGLKSFDFKAELALVTGVAAATPGSVLSTAAYTVAYL